MKTAAKHKPAIVYLATNSVNGKRYIGVTTRQDIRRRKSEHACAARRGDHDGAFYRAIRKYGIDAFRWRVLASCSSATEALAEEVRLVSELNPEYNSTKGGEYPPPPTEETIANLRRVHAGNNYRLGKRHSETTKQRLSEAATVQFQKGDRGWTVLGPQAASRKVVCLNDGRVFESASAAARHYGLVKSSVIAVCNRYKKNKASRGLVFRYFGEHHGGKPEADAVLSSIYSSRREHGVANQVSVVCLNDGRIFRSYQKAAEFYGLVAVDISCVCRGARGRKTAGGMRFEALS